MLRTNPIDIEIGNIWRRQIRMKPKKGWNGVQPLSLQTRRIWKHHLSAVEDLETIDAEVPDSPFTCMMRRRGVREKQEQSTRPFLGIRDSKNILPSRPLQPQPSWKKSSRGRFAVWTGILVRGLRWAINWISPVSEIMFSSNNTFWQGICLCAWIGSNY